nr:methyl-accepting chemotaxis protein [Comamonas serinivorans]
MVMAPGSERFHLPLLGIRTAGSHRRILGWASVLSVLLLILAVIWALTSANQLALQVASAGQGLTQSQRLAKSVSQALQGQSSAFPEVRESARLLTEHVKGLATGTGEIGVQALGPQFAPALQEISALTKNMQTSADTVLQHQNALIDTGALLKRINNQSNDLLEATRAVQAMKVQAGAPNAEVAAAGELVMLTQRISKSANEYNTMFGVSPDASFILGRDLASFSATASGLLDGSAQLRLSGTREPQTRDALDALIKMFGDTRSDANKLTQYLPELVAARDAQLAIQKDSATLLQQLQALQDRLSSQSSLSIFPLVALIFSILLGAFVAVLYSRTYLAESRTRQVIAEQQRIEAEAQQAESKRINDANQAAILRLMNELQAVAEGDLTQEATVTEDITGAIADSVNYTVEELRSLVGNVQSTATKVAQTTARVENTSTDLLATSTQQLREIRETGQSVLDMADRINAVSAQAQESATVARQSLLAADSGLNAVQKTIGGMNAIRDQIQDTSKRIKRLGESSQEIGEITELISDLTEQTNVLALNAAIQAASAGEAGRGFSVVAEEVQRLAERSADATRQIATLVKAIQTDTQDAVAAMERSTVGVVEGAKLSDNAGAALTEIDSVTRRLAELIQQISNSALQEAHQANEVAGNIQHIFAVTEQTGEGTRSTANQVRELSRMADELRQSVARFKIS